MKTKMKNMFNQDCKLFYKDEGDSSTVTLIDAHEGPYCYLSCLENATTVDEYFDLVCLGFVSLYNKK